MDTIRGHTTTADPVLRALLEAPPDAEPETRDELAQGQVRTLEEVRREWEL